MCCIRLADVVNGGIWGVNGGDVRPEDVIMVEAKAYISGNTR